MPTENLPARWTALAALAASCCAAPARDDETSTTYEGPTRARRPVPGLEALMDMSVDSGPGLPPYAAPQDFTTLDPAEARQRLWSARARPIYAPPTPARASALAALVRRLLADSPPDLDELETMSFEAGYEVHAWRVAGQRLLAAVEPPTRQTGGGAFLFRLGPHEEPPVILQAPHAFHDAGTERIALSLLLRGRGWPRALFVNTVHRFLDIEGSYRERDATPADPCHNPGHLFAVATAAALDVLPHAEVLQLHGFDDDDGETSLAAIVSGGEPAGPTPRSREVARRLSAALGVDVALFPVDTDRLGGATHNAQARLVRDRGRTARFVHIELSAALRTRLQRETDALADLLDALRPSPVRPSGPRALR